MTNSGSRLPALSIPGLVPDNPGNYLASLGLLRLLARRWPRMRIAWREGILHAVDGPTKLDEVVDVLADIAVKREWTPYTRPWAAAQEKSSALAQKPTTSGQSGKPFALWAAEADEEVLELFAAHVVPTGSGRSFNPVLGKAGTIGQRNFAKGWERAVEELAKPQSGGRKGKKARTGAAEFSDLKNDLEALLQGEPTRYLRPNLNAGSWFSTALKLYNSGQSAYREEPLSPWLMVLACEGLAFLAGSTSRRLGARVERVKGAFPFVTEAAAPLANGEAGRDSGELWAPLWVRPMTLPEVRALFSRGRAEIRGRGAVTPSAFAAAIVRRGIDAGIAEFRRFVFGWTTAQDYMEPRLEAVVRLPTSAAAPSTPLRPTGSAMSNALDRVLGLIERLPRDERKGRRLRFVGLRGPIEKAMIELAAAPEDPGTACVLLDAIVAALDRVDRTQGFRKRRVGWEPLPTEWLPTLFGDGAPELEACLALACRWILRLATAGALPLRCREEA